MKPNAPTQQAAPPIPDQCMVGGCDHPTHIAIAIVTNENGWERSCLFSEMRFGERFVSWVTRCCGHYQRELYAKGRGQFSPKPGDERCDPRRLELCEMMAACQQAQVKPLAEYRQQVDEDRRAA